MFRSSKKVLSRAFISGEKENMFLPAKGENSFIPQGRYSEEEETQLLHSVHATQTSYLLYLHSYLSLLTSHSSLSSHSSHSRQLKPPKHLDLSSCSLALSRVVSNEFWSSQHRQLAAGCLEKMIGFSKIEVTKKHTDGLNLLSFSFSRCIFCEIYVKYT